MPSLLGVTDQLGSGGAPILIDGTLPVVVFAQGYAGSEADLETALDAQVAAWNGSAPLFVAVQGDMNEAAIHAVGAPWLQTHYASNADVVFVRGDTLFELVRESRGLPLVPASP